MRKRIVKSLFWIPVVGWMGVIFYFSTLPEAMTPGRDILPDKLCHAGEYFILASFIFLAIHKTKKVRFFTSFWVTTAWVAAYGLSDEIHQLYVPTRHFEVADLAADVGGAVVLFFLLWALQRMGRQGEKIYNLLIKELPG